MPDFAQTITTAYATDGAALDLGRGVHDGAVVTAATVKLPLRMVNRHGLIAGATGTGKTKTLQGIAEQLSSAGVPVFVADVKGDLSGVAEPGDAGGAAAKRAQELGLQFQARGFPVEFFALGGIGPGIPIRATVSDFGPQLLAKVLGANDTQEQSLTLVFHYADAKGLPLLDLSDLRALLSFLASDAGKADLTGIGGLSPATVGVLLRSLTGLEDGGGTEFFGEPMLDVHDLMRTAPDGRGIISCLELPAVQDKPTLFSTALMWLLGELFEELPEAGDLDKPKLAFFFDEAHLLFEDATKAFLTSVAQTVRLIRSKGVGVYFITQTPKDVPSEILGQLGNRVQHALRAFTPEDAKALKATVSTFPKSADERGERVVDPAHRVEVLRQRVAGQRLDDQPGAVRVDRLPDVPGRADRVAHVVQAVEGGDEVVPGPGEGLRGRDLEPGPVGQPGVGGALARGVDGRLVVVRADDRGRGVGLGQQHGRRPVAAADVGHPAAGGQLLRHAVQRRDPAGGEVGDVTRPEEHLAAGEHVLVVLVPAHPGAGPERVGDLRLGPQRAQREQERARQVQRPVRVGQREGLLFGQREPPGGGIAADVAARRLPAQPLRDVPRVGSGPPRQLLRGGRPLGQGAEQAQPVPDDDVPGRAGGAQVADEPAEQLAQLVLIYGHDGPLSSGRGQPLRGPSSPASTQRQPRDRGLQ